MSGAVEMTFEFLSILVGKKLLAAEVDNMARTVRFRYSNEHDAHDTPGVAPSAEFRFYGLEDAFVLERTPGQVADRLVLKRDWQQPK